MPTPIKPRERTAILASLSAGTVPNIGLQYLQVGRKPITEALLADIQAIADGGARARFLAAVLGAGKTFTLRVAGALARQMGLVVLTADIGPTRPLVTSSGETSPLYSELVRNMSIRAKPDGNALASVVEALLVPVRHETGGTGSSDAETLARLGERLRPLHALVGGFDFARVVERYGQGVLRQDVALQETALRWLCGEARLRQDFKAALGTSRYLDGEHLHEHLKLVATLCHIAGFKGLIVMIDELGILSHRMGNARTRSKNLETIFAMFNDCLQGNVSRLGYLFAGVPEFIQDEHRGLYSNSALRSRLQRSTFQQHGYCDYAAPVIELPKMVPEELLQLLRNIRLVHAWMDDSKLAVPDECLELILACASRDLGVGTDLSPRQVSRTFTSLLQILDQDPKLKWQDVLPRCCESDSEAVGKMSKPTQAAEEDLASFTL